LNTGNRGPISHVCCIASLAVVKFTSFFSNLEIGSAKSVTISTGGEGKFVRPVFRVGFLDSLEPLATYADGYIQMRKGMVIRFPLPFKLNA